jgi:hypothetical protein
MLKSYYETLVAKAKRAKLDFAEIALAQGVSAVTLWRWKNNPSTMNYRIARRIDEAISERAAA